MPFNVYVLALCQALMMSAMTLLVSTAALVGFNLAEDKSLSTLPLALVFVSMMISGIPASFIMARWGRKAGFILACLFALTGALLATLAIVKHQFWLFVLATACIGVFNGFGNYFRFTAVEVVDAQHKSRAVSWVMAGGVIAAILGPNLANWMQHGISGALFAGSYASLILVYAVLLMCVLMLRLPHIPITRHGEMSSGRSLFQILIQPGFHTAMVCAMLGYGVMSLVMTATPLSMQHHNHSFNDTAFVIQWHVLGMFAPSFITGSLIRYFGVIKILFSGALLGIFCVMTNLMGHTVTHYWLALVLLGVSWNFLFIGATVLLTDFYRPEEKSRAQALNEFSVYTTVAIASLSSGALLDQFGWKMVNLGVLPLLAIILIFLSWFVFTDSRRRTPDSIETAP